MPHFTYDLQLTLIQQQARPSTPEPLIDLERALAPLAFVKVLAA